MGMSSNCQVRLQEETDSQGIFDENKIAGG